MGNNSPFVVSTYTIPDSRIDIDYVFNHMYYSKPPTVTVDPTVYTQLEQPKAVLPVANFSSNVTSGYAPLSVQFNDSSENATECNWDFGDGYNCTEQNPLHIYNKAGNYTVNLTAINANGTNSRLFTIKRLPECYWTICIYYK